MAVLLVDYDLNQPVQNYPQLIEKIKSYVTWCHYLRSSWFISATLTPVQLRDQLLPYIDTSDDLVVIDVTRSAAAWYGLPDDVSAWIQQQMPGG